MRDLQRRLRQLGYRPGPVDGRFGPRTEAATRWFQYKHGLARTGRVDRSTLTVLRARSDHRPLRTSGEAAPTESGGGGGTESRGAAETRGGAEPDDGAEPAPVANTSGDQDSGIDAGILVIAALLALIAGLLAGHLGPDLIKGRHAGPDTSGEPEPAPPATTTPATAKLAAATPAAAPPATTTPVYGYVTVDAPLHADTALAALAALCSRRGWTIKKIAHDSQPASGRIADRPGLVYALREIRAGVAEGLIVARVSDLTTRFGDLVTLVEWMSETGAFVASADRELDTSTGTGRATAHAIVELGTPGRFKPELGPRLAAMRDRGIPLRAIADALNLARIPNPTGHTHWRPANVQAATRDERHMRS